MFGRAIAEFEFTLTFANAPIDRFARGQQSAMTDAEKRGALVFFGEGKCVTCHAVEGQVERDVQRLRESRHRRAADRAVVRRRHEQHDLRRSRRETRTSARADHAATRRTYKFRTAPLRNIAAVAGVLPQRRVHDDWKTPFASTSIPTQQLRPGDSGHRRGSDASRWGRACPCVDARIRCSRTAESSCREAQIRDLTQFVKTGLLDQRAKKENLCDLVPKSVPEQAAGADVRGLREQAGQERQERARSSQGSAVSRVLLEPVTSTTYAPAIDQGCTEIAPYGR